MQDCLGFQSSIEKNRHSYNLEDFIETLEPVSLMRANNVMLQALFRVGVWGFHRGVRILLQCLLQVLPISLRTPVSPNSPLSIIRWHIYYRKQ